MISTNQKPNTLSELKNMEIIPPDGVSSKWKGIQHAELVECINEELDTQNIKVLGENWYASGKHDGRLSGSMELSVPGHTSFEGSNFSLGVQHSNLGDQALKFAVGAKIFICTNGMVVGDYAVKRRHTGGLDLKAIVSEGITTYMEKIIDVTAIQSRMAEKELHSGEVEQMLMEAGRCQILPWSRIGQVDQEYRHPTFADHNEKTAWGLYNAFTYIAQKSSPTSQIKAISDFREIVLA